MKKIVGTILAAGLALSAFAAEPAANFVMANFDGSAGFGFKANFAPTNAEFGMFNSIDTSIKFGLITEGTKGTTGDGIWGDLQIKFADGLNWEGSDAGAAVPSLKKPSVEVAKIHFVDGDFSAALDIKTPGLGYGAFGAPCAVGGTQIEAAAIGNTAGLTNGFGLEVAMNKLFAANFKFMDNGLASEKKFGLAFDASLKAVENLDATVAGTFNFGNNYMGFGTNVAYKLGINDKLYVKPGVAFTMSKLGDAEASNSLMAGALFGWGAADQEPGFKWVKDKTTEGVSVGFGMDFKDNINLKVGLYDQSLFSLLGLDDFGTLKTGALFTLNNNSKTNVSGIEVAFGTRYDVSFSPVDFHLGADLDVNKSGDNEAAVAYLINVKLSSGEIIDNTDVYVEYNIGDTAGAKKIDTNDITVGTKIHF